jgi:S1-C subfamily serine protease
MTKIRSSSAVCLSRRQWGLACFAFGAASFLGSSTACRGEDTKSISAPPATQSRSDQLAQATVRIVHGNGTGLGSGFHFVSPETIVTNAHVAKPLISGGAPLFAHAETGQRWALALIDSSPEEQFDFAILKASGASFDNRISLSPELSPIKSRGRRILYAGFPHGLEPLLVASSEVTAPPMAKFSCSEGWFTAEIQAVQLSMRRLSYL